MAASRLYVSVSSRISPTKGDAILRGSSITTSVTTASNTNPARLWLSLDQRLLETGPEGPDVARQLRCRERAWSNVSSPGFASLLSL